MQNQEHLMELVTIHALSERQCVYDNERVRHPRKVFALIDHQVQAMASVETANVEMFHHGNGRK
jgi:hypothetical protein